MVQQPPTAAPLNSVALVGLGAVGILFAAPLAARLPGALRVVADAARIARYTADPPSLNGQRLAFTYVTPDNPGPPADLVLVGVKATNLTDALPAIQAVTGPRTQILPLLNGISAPDDLAPVFGWARVLHGFVYCDSSMRTGHAVRQNGKAKIVFGEVTNASPSPRVMAVAELLDRAGIRYDIPADMRAAQWKKFILNIGINQAQAFYREPSARLQQDPAAMALARQLMDEAAAVGHALGIAGVQEIPAWAEDVIRAAAPDSKTSMLQDVEAGRPTEVDLFAGTVCRLAAPLGIPVPANEQILRALTAA